MRPNRACHQDDRVEKVQALFALNTRLKLGDAQGLSTRPLLVISLFPAALQTRYLDRYKSDHDTPSGQELIRWGTCRRHHTCKPTEAKLMREYGRQFALSVQV